MIFMEGIRDGDSTMSMRQKAIGEMIRATEEYFAPELSDALQLKQAKEGVQDSPAGRAESDFPDEEEFADVPEAREYP
jgi:hypothetical protein